MKSDAINNSVNDDNRIIIQAFLADIAARYAELGIASSESPPVNQQGPANFWQHISDSKKLLKKETPLVPIDKSELIHKLVDTYYAFVSTKDKEALKNIDPNLFPKNSQVLHVLKTGTLLNPNDELSPSKKLFAAATKTAQDAARLFEKKSVGQPGPADAKSGTAPSDADQATALLPAPTIAPSKPKIHFSLAKLFSKGKTQTGAGPSGGGAAGSGPESSPPSPTKSKNTSSE